jgi:hypothetical protein
VNGESKVLRQKVIPPPKAIISDAVIAPSHTSNSVANSTVDEWTTIPAKKSQKHEEQTSSSSKIVLSSTLDVLQASESTGESKKKKKKKKKEVS